MSPSSSSPHIPPQWEFPAQLVFVLAAALPFGIFLSPVTVFVPAIRTQTRIRMPPLALSSQTAQCLLFLLYSLVTANTAGVIANASGFVLGAIFLILYPHFCDREKQNLVGMYRFQLLVVLAITGGFLVGFFGSSEYDGGTFVAPPPVVSGYASVLKWAALAFGLLLFTHPFFVIFEVMKTGRAELMGSTVMNMACAVCALDWVLFAGFVQPDVVFLIQNSVGLIVNIAALTVRARHRRQPETMEGAGGSEEHKEQI